MPTNRSSGIPTTSAATRETTKRFGRYIARSLADGSPSGSASSRRWWPSTEQWLARADEDPSPPPVDRTGPGRADDGHGGRVPLLHEHVSRAIGVDIFRPEGDRLVALGLLDICSHRLLDGPTATAAGSGYRTNPQPGRYGGQRRLRRPVDPSPGRDGPSGVVRPATT